MVERALPRLKNHRISYLNGDAGPLALGAVLYHKQGNVLRSQELIQRYHKTILFLLNFKFKKKEQV
jgi:hypothetical protein